MERLESHAKLHDAHVPHDEEQAQFAADLRQAIAELTRLRAENAELRDLCRARTEAEAAVNDFEDHFKAGRAKVTP